MVRLVWDYITILNLGDCVIEGKIKYFEDKYSCEYFFRLSISIE